jgi:hypothetical protein
MQAHAADLRAIGVEVVSRWIDGHHEVRPDIDANHSQQEAQGWAYEDLTDIERADMLVLFTESNGYRRGGCLIEFGYALGNGLNLAVVGPTDNVFTCLWGIRHYDDWAELLKEWMAKEATP